MELRADPERRVPIFDPLGRQLMMSCGTAVFNARVALAAAGRMALVQRFPDRTRPTLIAVLDVGSAAFVADPALAALEPMIDLRRTNHRPFMDREVATCVVDELIAAARTENADLVEAWSRPSCDVLRKLTVAATEQRLTVPGYRAELRAWAAETSDRLAGVPAPSSPELPPEPWSVAADPVLGALVAPAPWGPEACLVLTTEGDHPADWVRAGEALERVLLEATARGLAVALEASAIEVNETRRALRHQLGLRANPQLILRVGYARPVPPTPRRPVTEVVKDGNP